jgi:hypothetical protein
MVRWCLDDILYTPWTLTPLARWATLEDNERSCLVGLPNDCISTNHLPIAASFKMHGHLQLCNGSKRTLIDRLNVGGRSDETKAEDNQIDGPQGESSEKQ